MYPVWEDRQGCYWIGGTPSYLFELLFNSKNDARKALARILQVGWTLKDGELVISRATITPF